CRLAPLLVSVKNGGITPGTPPTSSGDLKPSRKKKPRSLMAAGFRGKTLAMTYSRMLSAHYHRRVRVSLPSSGWDRVVPRSYCHQGEGGGSRGHLAIQRAHALVGCLGTGPGTGPPSANKLGR